MSEAPDRYEQAAKMRLKEGKSWQQIKTALSLSDDQLYKLRREINYDFETALILMLDMRTRRKLRYKNHPPKKNVTE